MTNGFRAKSGVFALQTLTYVLCALFLLGYLVVAWKTPKEIYVWKSGFKFAFGRNKKDKVFGIISHL